MLRGVAPEGFLDADRLRHRFADQIGIAHRRRQIGGVGEPGEGVVDLLPGCAALAEEERGVLLVERLALVEAGGDGVVDGHVLAVERHLPGDL